MPCFFHPSSLSFFGTFFISSGILQFLFHAPIWKYIFFARNAGLFFFPRLPATRRGDFFIPSFFICFFLLSVNALFLFLNHRITGKVLCSPGMWQYALHIFFQNTVVPLNAADAEIALASFNFSGTLKPLWNWSANPQSWSLPHPTVLTASISWNELWVFCCQVR